jgi:hypothetical protein
MLTEVKETAKPGIIEQYQLTRIVVFAALASLYPKIAATGGEAEEVLGDIANAALQATRGEGHSTSTEWAIAALEWWKKKMLCGNVLHIEPRFVLCEEEEPASTIQARTYSSRQRVWTPSKELNSGAAVIPPLFFCALNPAHLGRCALNPRSF